MIRKLNHREIYVYENQDRLALKEMGIELNLCVKNVHKMLKRANNFFGRTSPKKRANKTQ